MYAQILEKTQTDLTPVICCLKHRVTLFLKQWHTFIIVHLQSVARKDTDKLNLHHISFPWNTTMLL